MMRRCLMLSALVLTGFCATHAQYKAEYFFDADPGYGNAVQTSVDIGTNELLLSTDTLSEGFHLLGIRSVDAEGRWSSTVSHPVLVTNDLVYAGAEYFVDTDPGEGMANHLAMSGDVVNFSVPTDELTAGSHTLVLRARKPDNGSWIVISETPFSVVNSAGVVSVTMDMDVKISCANGMLHLTSSENMEATVEVFSLDGRKLLERHWDKGMTEMTLDVSNRASSLILRIECKGGKRITRKISQK